MGAFNSRKGYAATFAEPRLLPKRCNGGRGAREMVDRRLNVFDGRLVAAVISNAAGVFSHNIAIVGHEGRPPDQFVHICPVVPTGLAGSLLAN
jgi:hypothetical protein